MILQLKGRTTSTEPTTCLNEVATSGETSQNSGSRREKEPDSTKLKRLLRCLAIYPSSKRVPVAFPSNTSGYVR